MRGSLPVIAILAAGALIAAVYVSGRGHDNASGSKIAADGTAKGTHVAAAGAPAAEPGAPGSPGIRSAAAETRLNTGKLAAFVYKSEPEPVPTFPFFDEAQQTKTIGSFKGKVVLLNLWATWCGPCREEMPSLDRLQKDLGSDKFEVVALNVDKNGFEKAQDFLKRLNVSSLAFYADPTMRAANKIRAVGMPATLLIDANGNEIGRLMGPAEWDSPDAKRLIEATLR